MILFLLTIGFISILSQVVILRELNVAFYGIELIYILAIGVWLLWTATGALLGRRAWIPRASTVAYLFVAFAVLLPLDIAFIRSVRVLFGGIPGSYLPFGQQLLAITIALLPIGVLLGLLFQWVAKLYVSKEKTLAMAYAIECVGGIAGGLAATLLLKIGIQNFTIAVGCSLLTAAIIVFPLRRSMAHYTAVVVFAALLAVMFASQGIDHWMTRVNHPLLLDTRDSPYGRITITEQQDQFVVFENDAVFFETESAAAEEIVHLAAIHIDPVERVLVLGGGLDGILAEILKHKPQQVDYVELNPVLLSLAEKHLPESYRAPLRSQAVTVHINDPRRFVKDAEKYDLILIGMPDPTSGQSNRFYTAEFFEACAAALRPGGVLALRLKSSENVWTQFVAYRNTSIYRALKSVFADVIVLPGVVNINIASNRLLARDPLVLANAFKERSLDTRLVTPEYIHYMYTNDRFFEIADRLASTDIQPNTDIEPVCYKYSIMIWLSKFVPALINRDLSESRRWSAGGVAAYIGVILLAAGIFAIARRLVRLRRTLLVFIAGFVGMVVETILILHYQVKSGVLFQNIGILLMAFMAGLAVGSVVVLRAAKGAGDGFMIRKSWGYGLLLGFAVLNMVFIGFLYSGLPSNLGAISLLLFLAGVLVAGVFAYASLAGITDQKTVVSPLYAADLIGGCVGSLVASLLLIPFLGMAQSAVLIAALSVVALLLV